MSDTFFDTPQGCIVCSRHMKTEIQRINNIIGQLEGIKKMLEDEKDCFLVLTQMKAAKSALNALTTGYLSDQFITCMAACANSEKKALCSSFMKEIVT